MIQTIFFDFDGVLTTDSKGSLTISKNICREVPGLSVESVLASFREDISLLNSGQQTLEVTWKRLCSQFNIPESGELQRKIIGTVPLNDRMFALARHLSKQYRLGVISDNSRERMDILEENLNLKAIFNPIIVSAVEHTSKSDGTTRIFDIALVRTRCKPEEALYIDNQQKNLATPAGMGMHVYFHDDAVNDMDALLIKLAELGINGTSTFEYNRV